MPRRLIVNADDFGFTQDVNAGVVEAHERGILCATTLMANGLAFDDAVRLAREHPSLEVGVHFVLVGGESIAHPGRALPGSVAGLLAALRGPWNAAALREEARAQIGKIVDAGLTPLHIDAHKHVHILPPVLDALLEAAAHSGIRWIRRPFDLPLTAAVGRADWKRRLTTRALATARGGFERKLRGSGLLATDHFAGFRLTGSLRDAELAALIRELPDGLTELMTHPGRCGPELLAAPTRLKQSREAELEALCSQAVREAIAEAGVELCGYSAL